MIGSCLETSLPAPLEGFPLTELSSSPDLSPWWPAKRSRPSGAPVKGPGTRTAAVRKLCVSISSHDLGDL